MPKAARITSIRALGAKDGKVDLGSTQAIATLLYGVVEEEKGVTFNEITYPKGTFLSARGSVILL